MKKEIKEHLEVIADYIYHDCCLDCKNCVFCRTFNGREYHCLVSLMYAIVEEKK